MLNIDAFLRVTDAASAQIIIFRIRPCGYLLYTRRQRNLLIGLDQVPDRSAPRFRFGQDGAESTGIGIPAVLSRRVHNGNAAVRLVGADFLQCPVLNALRIDVYLDGLPLCRTADISRVIRNLTINFQRAVLLFDEVPQKSVRIRFQSSGFHVNRTSISIVVGEIAIFYPIIIFLRNTVQNARSRHGQELIIY